MPRRPEVARANTRSIQGYSVRGELTRITDPAVGLI
jgi:hypothetical protein